MERSEAFAVIEEFFATVFHSHFHGEIEWPKTFHRLSEAEPR